MYFLVRNIFERNLLEDAKLIAGKKGIDSPVLWVNFMEILDALDSLQKGELLVTTGFQLDDKERYQDFILRLKSRGVCAVAIQTGYYIHEIPQYIIDDANRYDFPVIELPAKLTFSQIMHLILENISMKKEEKNDTELITLKSKAKKLIESYPENPLNEQAEEERYLFLLSTSVSSNAVLDSALMMEAEKLKAYFTRKSSWVGMEISGSKVLYFLSLKNTVTTNDVMVELINLITLISKEDRVNVWIGFSSLKRAGNAGAAFDQALSAHQMLRNIGTKKGICYFNDLRLFEWFEYFHKKNNSLSFAYDALKPIIAYDYFHKSEYLQTLRVFLANECKISETADKLFIHRHTLKNRLNRISSLCSMDFEDYLTRLHFSIALMVYDYFLS
jgi:DNA-binding PucR family transcriptional regulator